jgi:hypothetical protein
VGKVKVLCTDELLGNFAFEYRVTNNNTNGFDMLMNLSNAVLEQLKKVALKKWVKCFFFFVPLNVITL